MTVGTAPRPSPVRISGYGSKLELLDRYCRGRSVLHLGAVGETCQDTELRVARATDSVHAHLTQIASHCVGIDNDEPSVTALTQRNIFDNLLLADVTSLQRSDITLPTVDVVVVGDTIEHLSEPGRMLDVVDAVSDPGTRLLLTTPNALGLGILVRYLRGRTVEGPDHVCSFNVFTLSNLLARHGWTLDEVWTCHQPKAAALNPRTFQVGRTVLSQVPRLGGTLFAAATRR